MASLKIAYNYHLSFGAGGIVAYSRGLLDNLCNIAPPELNFFLFYNSFRGNFPKVKSSLAKNCEIIKTRLPLRLFLQFADDFKYKILYPNLCRKYKIDIFHGTDSVSLRGKKIKSISTVHDVFFKINPALSADGYNKHIRKLFYELNKYDSIIAASNATKEDLVNLNIDAEKITVIYQGLDDIFLKFSAVSREQREEKMTSLREKYSLPKKYFLYVGNFVPRKNVPGLIEIFHKYQKSRKTDIKLVLAGPLYGSDYAKAVSVVDKLGISGDVLFIGSVANYDLPYVYYGAEIFLFLSLYEGFGRPPLEAMACGTPAVVADNSSLREITKGHAILVNANDDNQILCAIDKVLSDKVYVKELTLKAAQYARGFNWDKAVKDTINLYKKVAG